MRPWTLVPALLLLLPALAGPAGANHPDEPIDGACDATSLLVCARAGAGGSVACSPNGPVGTCTWSAGAVWVASSRLGLPGAASVTTSGSVEVCLLGPGQARDCTTTPLPDAIPDCGWLPASHCGDAVLASGSVGPQPLLVGQALQVTVSKSITVRAVAPDPALPLGTVVFTIGGGDVGRTEHLDDGRGG